VNNLFLIGNALEDATRQERGITSDSPAASHKVFHLARAARKAGVRTVVVSLGRGRADGSFRYFPGKAARVNGVSVVYLPFTHIPILSELLTLLSLAPLIWRLRLYKGHKAVVFYNRMPSYLTGLVLARLLRFRTVLDLEDGETVTRNWSFAGARNRLLRWLYDALCSDGAMLACSALAKMTKLQPTLCCYGTYEAGVRGWREPLLPINVLMGGTISVDTGAQMLIDVIAALRKEVPFWAVDIRIEITGKGDCLQDFQALAEDAAKPEVVVHGRMTDDKYREVLARIDVGLALKPNSGELANTTFPSKVIEYAGSGVLVITTDISDVRTVLGSGAIYLVDDDPQLLIEKLRWVAENREEAGKLALEGRKRVAELCSPEAVGRALDGFLFAREERDFN
jgi:glycosyltransferase involved in cell wall biosynthesis